MQVALTPKLEALVREKVESGLYDDASDVIRDALRLMQRFDEVQRGRLERLRNALVEGEADIAAGRSTVVTSEEELDAVFAQL